MIYNFGVNKHTIVTVAERLKKRWKYLNEKYQSKIANKLLPELSREKFTKKTFSLSNENEYKKRRYL